MVRAGFAISAAVGSKKTAAVDVRLDPKDGPRGGAVTPALLNYRSRRERLSANWPGAAP